MILKDLIIPLSPGYSGGGPGCIVRACGFVLVSRMFKIIDKDIKRYERDLKTFAKRAFPFATKDTLNRSAFMAQGFAKEQVRSKMTTRNRFTEQSIRVDMTRTLDVRKQAAVVGSIAPYMEDQEFGAIRTKRGSEGVPIPTAYSAGQGRGTKRTRLPRKPNKLQSIQLTKRRRAANRKQRTLFAVQDAVTTGRRYVFLDMGRRRGIFKVVGGRKGFKRGWPKGARLQMVYDLTSKTVTIPPSPWLTPAVDMTRPRMPEIYRDSLLFQIKRNNLFRG